MFLYISYALPIAAGLVAEGKTWTEFGPFRLGVWSKPIAVLSLIGVALVAYAGIQPPFDILINYAIGLVVLLLVIWFGFERKRFQGPPIGDMIAKRQAEIRAAERAVGEPAHCRWLAAHGMRVAAIDQGTTSTRLLVVEDGVAEIRHAVRHRQDHPRPGWVEHDPLELLANVRACAEAAGPAAAIGLDNQGESCLAWDGATGEPLSPVIVWQDSRTGEAIERLRAAVRSA